MIPSKQQERKDLIEELTCSQIKLMHCTLCAAVIDGEDENMEDHFKEEHGFTDEEDD